VGATVGGILAVDEAEVFLAVIVRVRERKLDAVAAPVTGIVEYVFARLVLEQI
jgi:hypothetical protein